MKYSKIIVMLCILLVVVFTIGFLKAFITVGSEPTVLIGAFFGFVTIELWNLASIKRKEINKDEN